MKKLYALLFLGAFGAASYAQCTVPALSDVAGPGPICSGNTATLTATTNGESIHWFTQASGGTEAGSGTTFVTPPLSGTTTYWAEARNTNPNSGTPTSGGGKLSPSSTGGTTVTAVTKPWGLAFTATSDFVLNSVDVFLTSTTPGNIVMFLQNSSYITIQTITVAAPAGGTNSNPVQFTVPLNLAITGGNSYKLVVESGPAMIRDLGSGNNFPYAIGTVGTITGGTINNNGGNSGVYYFLYNWNFTPGSAPCNSARQQVTVTVNPTPAAPTASAQTFCESGTVSQLTANGTNLKWYNQSTGGTELTGETALASGNYYVSQTNGTCESARTLVAVSVNPIPGEPAAEAQSFCGATTILQLQATGTALKWYADESGGAPLAGNTQITSTDEYYVSQTVGSCESARLPVSITINELPDAPEADPQSYCGSVTVEELQADGMALKWYSASSGGTALVGTTPVSSGTYYVSQTVGTCESARTSVGIMVNDVPDAPEADPQSYCGSVTIDELQANGMDLKWYSSSSGGAALAGTTSVTAGTYYVSQSAGNCESGRTSVEITINDIPDAPDAEEQSFCGNASVSDLAPNGGELLWYQSETGPPLAPNTELASGTYYVQNTVNGCFSPFTAVEVSVNAVPDAPDGLDTQTVEEGSTIADLNVTGDNLTWYTDITMTTELDETTVLQEGMTYYVNQTVNGCPGPLLGVFVSFALGLDENQLSTFTYYPNPVEDVLTLKNDMVIDSVEVFSLIGQKVFYRIAGTEEVSIDLSALAAGTYVLKVRSGNALQTVRIIRK